MSIVAEIGWKSVKGLLTTVTAEDESFTSGRFTWPMAACTAAAASTKPNPYLYSFIRAIKNRINQTNKNKTYLWLWWKPAELVNQSESEASVILEVLAKMYWTSRHPRLGLACKTRATTPATKGAAADVPPKEDVQSFMELYTRLGMQIILKFYFILNLKLIVINN